MKTFRKVCKELNIFIKCLLAAALALLLAFNVNALVQRYALGRGIPTAFGYGCAVVVSGSMADEINVNDLVIVKECDTYVTGDVITFYDSSAGEYVTHRIIYVSESGQYTTKGDANGVQDAFAVPREAVVGKVVRVLRGAGKFISFMQSPAGLFAIAAGGVVVWLLTDLLPGKVKAKGINGKSDEREEN